MVDIQELSKEYIKCFSDRSRIYMIQNYLKTFDGTQGKEVPFELFPKQQELCHVLGESENSVATTKYRQAGITTVTGGFIACDMSLCDKSSPKTALIIGNTLDLAQEMLFKIQNFLLQIPLWFWGEEIWSQEGDDVDITQPPSNGNIIFKKCNGKVIFLKNGCKIYARSSGPNASRGISACHYLIFDETAFIENGGDVYTSALPTTSSVKGKAIFVSTPNGKDPLYYETCRRAKLKGTKDWNGFDLVEMHWYQDLRYNRFLEWTRKNPETGEIEIQKEKVLDEKGTVPYDEERWEQLIKDGWKPRSPWYLRMCRQFNNDPQKIAQELDVSFLGSDSTVVSPEYIEMQRNLNVREPLYADNILEDLWVWKEPIEGHRYLMSCLPTGEKVLTNSGLKNIEDVTLKDKLVSKDGNFVKINTIKQHFVENETMVDFKLCNMFNHVKFTWNHPIWSSIEQKITRRKDDGNKRRRIFNWKFNNALDIKCGDWIMIPNFYKKNMLNDEEIVKYWKSYENGTRIDFKINCPLLDENFWWFCGIWLAEGWCIKNKNNSYTIYTAHNINEKDIINKIKNICQEKFKRNVHQTFYKTNNGTTLRFNCTQIAKFLCDTFGKYAKNKHVPEWVKFLPEKLKLALLRGYFEGDGCITHDCVYIVSVSKKLLTDIQDMFFSVGVISGLFLSSKEKYVYIAKHKEISHCQEKYTLNCGKIDSKIFLCKIGVGSKYESKFSRRIISNCYFSDDMNYIYVRIKEKNIYKYTGLVHNFDCETHTFCGEKIATHNCDNSRGSSDDATALEIIDMDGIDDDGTPCVEQVLEYNGKMTGDAIGEIAYKYAMWYNMAYIIVEDIGGYGSATLLTLMNLEYPNLYYDDPTLKKYTSQNEATPTQATVDGLPGFHSSSVRFQMLSKFANLVTTNQFKIRSKRVCAELDTWIFKNGRIDHKDGCHDDTLTCLAMGLFVMEYSLARQIKAKSLDNTMLKAMIQVNSRVNTEPKKVNKPMKNNNPVQIFAAKGSRDSLSEKYRANMWLLS